MVLFAILSSLVTASARAQAERTVPPNPFAESPSRDPAPERTAALERTSAVARTNAPAPLAAAPSPPEEAPSSEAIARADEQAELVPVVNTSGETGRTERPIEELAARAASADPPPPPPDGALGALDDVLADDRDPIAGVEAEPVAPPEPEGVPTRAETAAAIAAVTPGVRACARAESGEIVELRIVFTANGNVTTATVDSAHLTPAQRSCVARAARRAHVSAFARPRFEVTYPVRL